MDDEEVIDRLHSEDAKRFYRFYRARGKDQTVSLLMTLENLIIDLNAYKDIIDGIANNTI